VLSGRGLCDEMITRPGESYRMWYVVLCDLETSRLRRSCPALGRSATEKNNIIILYLRNIYDIKEFMGVSFLLRVCGSVHLRSLKKNTPLDATINRKIFINLSYRHWRWMCSQPRTHPTPHSYGNKEAATAV
jgi:hypothetical protein